MNQRVLLENLEGRLLLADASRFLFAASASATENTRTFVGLYGPSHSQSYSSAGLARVPSFTASDPAVLSKTRQYGTSTDANATADVAFSQSVSLDAKTVRRTARINVKASLDFTARRDAGVWNQWDHHIEEVSNSANVTIFGHDADGFTSYKVHVYGSYGFAGDRIRGNWSTRDFSSAGTSSQSLDRTYYVEGDQPFTRRGKTYERVSWLNAGFNDNYNFQGPATEGRVMPISPGDEFSSSGTVDITIEVTAFSSRPKLVVEPTSVNFGTFTGGPGTTKSKTVTIRNANTNPFSVLSISGLGIGEAPDIVAVTNENTPATSLLRDLDTRQIGPGEKTTFRLQMRSMPGFYGAWSDEVALTSNDPDAAITKVPVRGQFEYGSFQFISSGQSLEGGGASLRLSYNIVHDLTPKVAIRNADGSEVASLQATRVEGDRADFTTNSAPLVDEALAQMRSQRGTDSVSFQVDAEASRMSQLRVAKVTKDAQEITVLAKAKPASATTYGEALSASVGLTAWLAWPPVRPTASVNALWMQALSSARFSHLKIMTPSADDAPPIFLTEVNTLHGPGRLWGASVDPTRGIKSKKLKDYRLTDLLPADVYKGSKLTAISERVAIDTGITDLFGTVIAEGNLVPDWSGLLRGRYFVNRWVPAGTVATAYATSATMQYFGSATGTTGSATFTRSLLPELPSINANLISVSVELLNGSTLDGESEVTLD